MNGICHMLSITTTNKRDGTVQLPPDSILSRYFGAGTICIENIYIYIYFVFLYTFFY